MNGGYLMVSKTDTKLYEKLNNALTLGKPVLWYEDENTCYYIDTITKSGTDIILTKGGKTITIESDGDITESGDVQIKKTYYYVFDMSDLLVGENNLDTDYAFLITDFILGNGSNLSNLPAGSYPLIAGITQGELSDAIPRGIDKIDNTLYVYDSADNQTEVNGDSALTLYKVI